MSHHEHHKSEAIPSVPPTIETAQHYGHENLHVMVRHLLWSKLHTHVVNYSMQRRLCEYCYIKMDKFCTLITAIPRHSIFKSFCNKYVTKRNLGVLGHFGLCLGQHWICCNDTALISV